eukprot:6181246-Pleurochrysis_carterae.AAC.1
MPAMRKHAVWIQGRASLAPTPASAPLEHLAGELCYAMKESSKQRRECATSAHEHLAGELCYAMKESSKQRRERAKSAGRVSAARGCARSSDAC